MPWCPWGQLGWELPHHCSPHQGPQGSHPAVIRSHVPLGWNFILLNILHVRDSLTLKLKSIYPEIFLPKISIIFPNVFTCSLSPILLPCCSDTPLWPFKCFFSQGIFQLVKASSRHRVSLYCSLTGSTQSAAWGVSGFPSPLALLLLGQLLGLLLPATEKASRLDPSEVPHLQHPPQHPMHWWP